MLFGLGSNTICVFWDGFSWDSHLDTAHLDGNYQIFLLIVKRLQENVGSAASCKYLQTVGGLDLELPVHLLLDLDPPTELGHGNGKSIPKRPLLTAVDASGECLLNLQILLISIFCKLLLRAKKEKNVWSKIRRILFGDLELFGAWGDWRAASN